jgi:protein AaeX
VKEFVVAGLLISPLVKFALVALILFVPLRLVLLALSFHRWVWHPLLAEACLYTCLLATLNILL